jgi:hypothetical protein
MRARFPLPPPPAAGPVLETTSARTAHVGPGGGVRRYLPHPKRRLIGAWCFVDHFGPDRVGETPLAVGPHPHMGLQTVTWLISGQILHRDSLGTEQRIRAGEVNWMTAGRGISHAEDGETPVGDTLHGVQLWVALPDAARHQPPAFVHDPAPPRFTVGGAELTLIAGRLGDRSGAVPTHSPLLAADLRLGSGGSSALSLDPQDEHGIIVLEGEATVAGQSLRPGALLYLGRQRRALTVASASGARLLLLGGRPLDEPVLVWWNWVFRDRAELEQATLEWNTGGGRFGTVQGARGSRIAAPAPPPVR